ncbi:MAG TPA: YraN family protein, partial [Bacillota bacterium]
MPVMSAQRRQLLGLWGEEAAAAYLRQCGFAILRRRYRCPGGEVDLVCRDGQYLVFVEVKTRATGRAGQPEEAVTPAKQR